MSDRTIGSLEKTEFLTLPAQIAAGEACASTRPEQAIVVLQEPDGRLVGVIPPAQVAALAGSKLPLDGVRAHWRPPTFVLADTLVVDVLRAMRRDKSIRWQVILRGPDAVGLVSPETLLELLRRGMGGEKGSELSTPVGGDPLSEPSGLCYLCTAVPAHYIAPERVEDRNADGQALCPCDGSVMYGTFVCPKELLKC
jgi:hypothetical protein